MKIKPMLAEKALPFDNEEWLFEIKWDGMRAEATIENEKICKLETRTGNDISRRFPEIIGTHVKAKQAIIDGEIISLDEKGMPSFQRIAQRGHLEDTSKIALRMKLQPCNLAVFDVMELNDESLIALPLTDRKAILESITSKDDGLIPSLYFKGLGKVFFDSVVGMGYEGVMAKKLNSPYLAGKRSDLWLKMKPKHKTICEITGYNLGEGHRERMGALLISEQGIERGRVGSGLMDKDIDKLLSILQPISRNNGTVLVMPTTQIEISYFERTEAGHFRFPVFKKIL